MTENCHMLKVHLEKLASAGHLDQYINTDLSSKKEPGQELGNLNLRARHRLGSSMSFIILVLRSFFTILQIQDAKGCPPQKILLYTDLFILPQCIR
jgi:hypothetical protein